jgi:hypothetical protein
LTLIHKPKHNRAADRSRELDTAPLLCGKGQRA